MITARPQSKYEDENGIVNLARLFHDADFQEYPEVTEWDRQYADECDQLAERLAARHKHHWGRWYLDGGYLCTPIYRAPEGEFSGGCHEVYDFSLTICITEKSRRLWIEHMTEKNWMGKQGIADLKRAFDSLIKSGIISQEIKRPFPEDINP
jgi:hypothetical protein